MSTRKAAAAPSPVAQYRYSVQWSPEDQEFVATVLEFPSLSWLDEDQFEALRGIERLVSDVIDELTQSGEPVPEPIATQKFSGRLNLRVPPELHRKLAIEAANHGMPLNKYATERLTA
ncbi:type II toxin-antitoxin system HicB family antitoxin [Pseudarthrobacter sp. NPDC058329]|uniref:type II toxin-antitoxin system HicB family antitoxin n=1 Tax=Pseudarthrobacter sp. NPDC058329 TaxID=3346448 RepID=UPI0036DF95A9